MEFLKLFLKILIPLLISYKLYELINNGFFMKVSIAHNLSKIYRMNKDTAKNVSQYTYAKYLTMIMMLILTDQDENIIKECSENIEKRIKTFISNSINLLSKFKDHDFIQDIVSSTPDELATILGDLATELQGLCDDCKNISNDCDKLLIKYIKPVNENYLVINSKELDVNKILGKMPENAIEMLRLNFHGSFKEVLETIGSFTITT